MIASLLFIFFCNFFAIWLAVSSLRHGKPAIVGTVLERSKGVSITRAERPIWYWLITGPFIVSAIAVPAQTVTVIKEFYLDRSVGS